MDIKFRLLALQKLAGCALIVLVSVGLIGIAALHPAHAQDAAPPVLDDACSKQAPNPLPFHVQPLSIASGYHRGAAVGAATPTHKIPGAPWRSATGQQPAFQTEVKIAGATWLQLRFGRSALGRHSYILLTAQADGGQQPLDASSLAEWQNQSALFNGESVTVALYVAPGDEGVFFELTEAVVGEPTSAAANSAAPGGPTPESVCGADDRVSSTDPAVGRLAPIGCTGWIASNGSFLTAGHCNRPTMTILEFNVPQSLANGTTVQAAPQDQYPVVAGSIVSMEGTGDNDWAVFNVGRNANTNLLPVQAQNAFYRLSTDLTPATIRITGYGVDGPAPCFGDRRQPGCTIPTPTPVPLNSNNQTQQTNAGPSQGLTGTHWEYEVDTQGGNSGSPIIQDGANWTVGIHTHGSGAMCPSAYNGGTAFNNAGLAAAITTFPGPNAIYVDQNHPVNILLQAGTPFRPYKSAATGYAQTADNGILSIVAGSYNETLTLNRPMSVVAPVGTVIIGAP
ncbi:MAG: trypsin-like serine protease [Anaerolineae bacterium]